MAGPKGTLLIVDDEEIILESLSLMLSKDNTANVFVARSGREALAILDKEKVDVVATDIRMPGIDGFELITKIKREHPETDFLIMTGFGSRRFRERADREGALFYIEKPFGAIHFREIVNRAFSERGQTAQEKEVGFEGRMRSLQLFDILQLYCLAQRTGKITIMSGRRKGEIFIDSGQIVHSVSDGTQGEEAIYDILQLASGRFAIEDGVRIPTRTIWTDWEHLLLEGSRRKDEMRREKEEPQG